MRVKKGKLPILLVVGVSLLLVVLSIGVIMPGVASAVFAPVAVVSARVSQAITGAANQVAFFTSATNVTSDSNLYWDNVNKRLGIASPGVVLPFTPERILHVKGTGANSTPLFERDTDAAGFLIQRTAANRWVFGASDANPVLGKGFSIYTFPLGDINAVSRLFIDLDGKVGINTVTPSAKLDVISGSDTGIKSFSHDSYGIYGISDIASGILGSSSHSGVEGVSTIGRGVYGTSDSGHGVEGYSTTNIGVYGQSGNISSYAGFFEGNVNITGNLIANGDNITSGTTGGVKHFKWMDAVNFDGNIYSNDWADIKAYPGELSDQRTFGMSCKHPNGCTYVSYLDGVRKAGNLNSGDTENITMSGNLSDARFLFGKKTNGMALLQGDVLDTNGAYMHFIIHDIEE